MAAIRFIVFTDQELSLLQDGNIRHEELGDDILFMAHESRESDVVNAIKSQYPDLDVQVSD